LNVIEAVHEPEAARLVLQVLLDIRKSAGFVPEIAMLLIVIEELVPFERVTAFAALLEPTAVLLKVRLVGFGNTLPEGAVPVPVSATFWGLPLAESLKFKVAERAPVVVGAKMMFAVQLAEAASVDPHVLLNISKSPGFVPENPMLLIVIALVPLFVSVTTFCPPLPPTGTDTQLSDVGVTATCAISAEPGKRITTATVCKTIAEK
jgi:hypothetical protein